MNLFDNDNTVNKLTGTRICLNGTFAMDTKEMNKKLKSLGVAMIDRVSTSRAYKEGETIPPAKEGTCLYVVGTNANPESIKRYELNVHDGFRAVKVNEDEFMKLINGTSDIEVPKVVEKKLDLTIDYYDWTSPTINDKVFTSRVSSPLKYDFENFTNPVSLKEIYVPDYPNVKMDALRQIIGNLGGYANKDYIDTTNVVMLSDETLRKLKNGEKDDVILEIENMYNNSDTKTFNVQFTSESDFLDWVKARQEKWHDESTEVLLKKMKIHQ